MYYTGLRVENNTLTSKRAASKQTIEHKATFKARPRLHTRCHEGPGISFSKDSLNMNRPKSWFPWWTSQDSGRWESIEVIRWGRG